MRIIYRTLSNRRDRVFDVVDQEICYKCKYDCSHLMLYILVDSRKVAVCPAYYIILEDM